MSNRGTERRPHIPLHEQEGDLVDEVEKVIEQVGCANLYYKLEVREQSTVVRVEVDRERDRVSERERLSIELTK